MARGAAILCANNQRAIDMLIPMVYWDNVLGRHNITVIIIQIKNDKTFTAKPKRALFETMNPYHLHIFDKDDKHPLPIIRKVFALAAPSPAVVVVSNHGARRGPPRAAKKKPDAAGPFVAYDIWVAGISSVTFGVVKPTEHEVYGHLLKLSRVFPQAYEPAAYETSVNEALRREMHPGTSLQANHWAYAMELDDAVTLEEVDYDDDSEDDDERMDTDN
jgi:hypothetical protein